MTAPKGNSFWKVRSSHGRKPIFPNPDTLWDACCEYFTWVEGNPLFETKPFAYKGRVELKLVPKMRAMTISGLCIFLDISLQTWTQYRARQGFVDIVQRVDEIIRTQKFEGAAAGLLDANLIAREMAMLDPPGNGNAFDKMTDEELAQEIGTMLEFAGLELIPARPVNSQKLLELSAKSPDVPT